MTEATEPSELPPYDTELVRRAMSGDHEAFAALAEDVSVQLYNSARFMLGDRLAAEEAMQDALIRAWINLPKLRDPTRFRPWMFRLLTRACQDYIRRAKRMRNEPVVHPRISENIDPSGLAMRDELARALVRMTSDHRIALVLLYYLDLPLSEAAAITGVPVGTMKSRASRALAAMRAELASQDRQAFQAETSR